MDTLYLDPTAWDLAIDTNGNIAMASKPYALAQDAASAIKLFLGEYWYDTTQGVAYWTQVFPSKVSLANAKAQFVAAALTVPEVVGAQCFITSSTNRLLSGQVQITDNTGQVTAVGFGQSNIGNI